MVTSTGTRLRRAVAGVGFAAGVPLAVVAGDAVSVVLFASYAGVGTFLAVVRPAIPVGWLLTTAGWGMLLGTLRVTVPADALLTGSAAPVDRLVASVTGWAWGGTMLSLLALALRFPTGRIQPGAAGRAGQVLLAITALVFALIVFNPTVSVAPTGSLQPIDVPNVLAVTPDAELWRVLPSPGVLFTAAFLGLALGVGSMLARYRQAVGAERLQLRWFAAAIAAVTVATFVWAVLAVVIGGGVAVVGWLAVAVAYPALPFAIGAAVLRYRLYDIDRLISRTISWTIMSATIAALFALLVFALQAVLAGIAGGSTLAVACSTLVLFAVFQPLRRRVQAAADRRFNRARVTAHEATARMTAQIRGETNLESISDHLLAAVDDALVPAYRSLWVRPVRRPPTVGHTFRSSL